MIYFIPPAIELLALGCLVAMLFSARDVRDLNRQ